MRFVDIKNDVAFRKIFGNEKKSIILISFLNAVLKLKNKDRIKKVKLKNPYQFPRIAGEKATIIDVSATDESGRQFIVEMQVADNQGFDKRVQYYASRDYSMQIKRGDDYAKLNPTIFIGILDFNYFQTAEYLSNHLILDEKTLENRLKDIRFCFIELSKFDKTEPELFDEVDKWIYFIKNAKDLTVVPENTKDKGLLEAYNDAEKYTWTNEDLREYDNAAIKIGDDINKIVFAKQKGEAEGALKAKFEIAKMMKESGEAINKISQFTGLSENEIENL